MDEKTITLHSVEKSKILTACRRRPQDDIDSIKVVTSPRMPLQQSFIARPAEQAVATLDDQILKNEAVSVPHVASLLRTPPKGVKNCDYNINMKTKNFPFELSIKIMLIVDKKGITKIPQYIYE